MKFLIRLAAAAATIAAPAAFAQSTPTVEEAEQFIARAEKELTDSYAYGARAGWIYSTYITADTEKLSSEADAKATELNVRVALEAARYLNVPGLSEVAKRKLDIMRIGLTLAAPTRPGAAAELSVLSTRLNSAYSTGKGTLDGAAIDGPDLQDRMGSSRNPEELKEMWTSWHDNVGRPMKANYIKVVALANEGARELGFADTGALWRGGYDMPAADFAAMTDRLWGEVKPLYDDLHCYTRTRLNETYGDAVQPDKGPIRADLLGNLWAQTWGPIYDLVAPPGAGDIGFDTTELLAAKGYDAIRMVKTGEAFFTSLGFDPLPETFWKRSMFTKPADREVVCHPSAWDMDGNGDLRLKMCIKVNKEDFATIHHELGHDFYYRAYKDQDYFFALGANDGFHEAIGDMLSLSITPDYLVEIGLLDAARVPGPDKDIGLLLQQAMDRIAFLPFGLLVDKWRWGVFDGSIAPENYNTAWDKLRLDYQGIVPPVARDADAFDAGGKFHVASTTPYMRYFLANILMFQFYEAACKQAGWTGPLHRCSFYGNKEVGAKFEKMLVMGASKPWPDALESFTGTREMSGSSVVNYFAPLQSWLKEQNKGKACGW